MPRLQLAEIFLPIVLAFAPFAGTLAAQSVPATELSVSKCWSNSDIPGGRAVASDGESIFVGSGHGAIGSLTTQGRMLWSSELGGRINSNLLVSDTSLVAVTSVVPAASGESVDLVRSLSKVTGVTNWIAKVPTATKYSLGIQDGDIVVAASSGQLLSLSQKTGSVKWSRFVGVLTAEPVFTRGKILAAVEGQQLVTLSLDSGEIENTRKLPSNASVVVENGLGHAVMGDERGNVYLLNGTDKPLWKFKSGGAITRLYVVIDYIVAVSNDNFVYHLLARNGDVDWKKRLSGRVAGAGLIGDKLIVTQSLDDPSVVLTDLQTGKTAGQIFVEPGEALTANVFYSGAAAFLLTDRGVYRVGIDRCDTDQAK
jgi:outer membrane protein assembly factor BamB